MLGRSSKVRLSLNLVQVDLGGKRKVDTSEGKLWAETKGFHYFETSAQSGEKVHDMFECLTQTVVSVLTKGGKPGAASMERGYSIEQASLVTRIRACPENYEMLGVSRVSSRYEIIMMLVCVNTVSL